jgi:hypothetical protein
LTFRKLLSVLYAWDGNRFRFVTDILGAAPLGLPIAEGRYIEADPEEFVWIGNEQTFPPRDGKYQLQITEELREVLYLDEAKLVVVDHEPGTEVHSTGKLLPGKAFPRGALMTLRNEHPLQRRVCCPGFSRFRFPCRLRRGSNSAQESLLLKGRGWPARVAAQVTRSAARSWPSLTVGARFRAVGREQAAGAGDEWLASIRRGHGQYRRFTGPVAPFPFPVLEAEVAPELGKPWT